MQIKNMEIQNYRKITAMSLEPKKITAIVGPNGSGKSSLLDAIRFALTGKSGNDSPIIRAGADRAIVSCDLFGSTIKRTVGKTNTVRMDGKTTTQKSVQKFIEDATGVTQDSIRVATSANLLAAMDAGKFADHLISNGLIPVEINFETFEALYPMSADAAEELSMMFPATPKKFDMDKIEELYQYYYSTRQSLKRELNVCKEKTAVPVTAPIRSKARIDAELQKLAANKAQQDVYKQLLFVYEDAIARRAQTMEKIAEIENRIRAEKVDAVDPNELTALDAQLKRLSEAEMTQRRTVQTLQMNIDMFTRTLENLGKPICPISNKLVCATDKTGVKRELEELIACNQEELDEATAKLEKTKSSIEAITSKKADYQKRLAAWQQYEALFTQRKAMKDAVPAVPEKPTEPIVIKDIAEQWAKLEGEKRHAEEYEAFIANTHALAELEKQLELVEEIVSALRPKGGVREKIVEVALTPLIEHCNERASLLKSTLRISLQADDGVHILYSPDPAVDLLPLNAASSGEQAFVLLLVMDALNALSGAGVLLLDDLDKLDEEAFESLLKMLSNPAVTDPYDHIFLAAVNHEDTLRILKAYDSVVDDVICSFS